MKFPNFALIITAFSSTLSACAIEKADSSILKPCVLVNSDTLKLTGLITPAMQSCALDLLTPDVTKVIVNSTGGDVDAGRAIGYQLGENPRTLIVETYCLSSCGNYFIPPARAVQLKSGAVIGLHGSPDPHMLSSESLEAHLADLEASESVTTSSVKRQLKRKKDHRDRH